MLVSLAVALELGLAVKGLVAKPAVQIQVILLRRLSFKYFKLLAALFQF